MFWMWIRDLYEMQLGPGSWEIPYWTMLMGEDTEQLRVMWLFRNPPQKESKDNG